MTTDLRLLARPFEGFETTLDRQIEAFPEPTDEDVSVERVHRPLPEIHEEYVAGGGFDGEFDLFLCLSDWLPALADGELLVPLSDRVAERPPPDWPDGWTESMRGLMRHEGDLYGVPYSIGTEINTGTVNTLPAIPEYAEFNEILNEAVEAVGVERSASPGTALEEAADRTRTLLGRAADRTHTLLGNRGRRGAPHSTTTATSTSNVTGLAVSEGGSSTRTVWV